KQLPGWFLSLRKLQWLLGVVIVAYAVPRLSFEETATAWRYTGWILDLAGLLTVVGGISAKLQHYRGEHLHLALLRDGRNVLRRFPLLQRNVVINAGTAHFKLGALSGSAIGHDSPREDAPTDEKIEFLIAQNNARHEAIVNLQSSLNAAEARIDKEIDAVRSALGAKVDTAALEQRNLAVEGVGVEVIGVLWIACGITCAAVPEVMVWLFG